MKGVGDGRNRHALMVRHIAAHDGEVFFVLKACRREIDCLVEPVATLCAQRCKICVILCCHRGINHCSQSRGIGGYHAIFAKSALQAQTWHPEIGILVGHFQIARIVG